ncbi:MAG: 50S ribosomal protein L11 methyltransferase [Proteobacteria bacterium]|nr:50S ribosomal protein L11 methyltransferase [Pseudomonadota bacterium]
MIPFNRDVVLDLLYKSEVRLTARAYIDQIALRLSIPLSQAKIILRSLVDDEELSYQDLYGTTYMTQNFLKPIRVTDHFFLRPSGRKSQAGPYDVDILIDPGISFGSGHHPTTRLCLAAIDFIYFTLPRIKCNGLLAGADIGTGSGVLAIALCLAGFGTCTAWDIDPNAVSEARTNVAANHLSHRISVIEDYMPVCVARFSVICANLRFPSLKDLSGLIRTSLCPGGIIIVSGIRQWERDDLISHYTKAGFALVWQRDEKNWSGLIMKHQS